MKLIFIVVAVAAFALVRAQADMFTYVNKLENFFACANNLTNGTSSPVMDAAFQDMRTSFENLAASQTPANQL